LGGVVLIISAILFLYLLPFIWDNLKTINFSILTQLNIWLFISSFLILTWIGACPVEHPYDSLGQIGTLAYFLNFLTIRVLKISKILI
jgi:ubiquinol-cytochrome c reductase cytochrome b subunit